ncbi:MAG: multidrug efflux system membrane fusion protein [Saprospiraceae bacterium]|jgi:multidrug efflux system membrane fusion protein
MRFLFFIMLVIITISCKDETVKKEVSIRPVKHITVKKSGVSEKHTFSGTAQAKESAGLSFKVAGTINKVFVKVGDRVTRGQLIASLEPTDYKVSLQQAEAQEQGSQANEQSSATQIKSAEANYIAANSAYQRITRLYENNSVSLSEFEQAKASFEAADAQFMASKAQYEAAKYSSTASNGQKVSAQNQVSYTRLSAPFSGIIAQQHMEENELVNSGTAVVTLSSTSKPEVVVGVPEVLISKVVNGMQTKVSFSTIQNEVFIGIVREVGYSPGSGSTYPITVDLKESSSSIRPGMPANVQFEFKQSDSANEKIIVPAAAVGEDTEGRFVYKLNSAEANLVTTQKIYVTIGKLRNEGFEILNGLSEGDLIAAAGLNVLLEGDRLKLLQ